MIGQRLLHYEIVQKLGEGGMGVVYKVRDTHLDRFVAIKVLPPEKVADASRKARFVQEAKAASALNHPNIVVVHDITADAGHDFMVMEYIAGKTLEQLIGRKGLALNETLKCAIQIADALARAHAAGIVHRDLKPSNVMVDEHGLVKVLDFGLAKLTELLPTDEDASTQTVQAATEEGTILGTAAYMSPEQAEGKKVDARSDIFSFGSVLYEMVSGRRAFQGDSKMSTLSAVLHQEPKPIEDVPYDLKRIISHCLRKDPDRRFQSMKDLKVELEELKEESDSGKLAPGVPAPGKPRRWLWVVGAGVLSVVAALAGWWLLGKREGGPAQELTAVPLTTYPGIEMSPTFSPDGSQVAFAWDGERQDNFDIYVMLIGPGTPLRLTNDPAADIAPSWSPDGRWIAFERYPTGARSRLVLIPALGGPERVLEEGIGGMQLSWSPGSKWIFASQQSGIVTISPETGEKRTLTTPPKGTWDTQPAVSPDGRRLSFTRRMASGRDALFVQRLTTDNRPAGEPFEVSLPNLHAYHSTWTPNGRDILFVGSGSVHGLSAINYPGQPADLWRVPADGSAPHRVAGAGDNIWTGMTTRGNRLSYTRWQADANIHRADLDPDGMIRKPSVVWLPSSLSEENAQYSPDGKMVVFSSARGGSQEVWLANADSSSPRQLTRFGGHFTGSSRWSPDGKTIVFNSRWEGKGQPDIFTISTEGTGLRRLTDDPASDARPSFSRDGAWVYFVSGRTRPNNVWKIPASGGPATMVTQNGGMLAQESADGKWLYHTKLIGQGTLWRMPLAGGDEERVVETVPNWSAFAAAERGISYLTAKPDFSGGTIHFLSYAGGQPKTIGAVDRPLHWGLSVSPDGKHIMYSQKDRFEADLMLVENFR